MVHLKAKYKTLLREVCGGGVGTDQMCEFNRAVLISCDASYIIIQV